MSIKRYSDFNSNVSEIKSDIESSNKIISNDIISNKEVNEPIKEELLLAPKDNSSISIEILEEKIIKFNSGHINDILETIKTKYSDTDYFIRKKDNQLHIVKYNESLKMNINEFVNTLLKYYSTNPELRKITEGIKVKGNQNFSVVENMNTRFSEKFITDLTNLLSKKK